MTENEVIKMFANWLKDYSAPVIIQVMEKKNDILNNEYAMTLLKELMEREEKEAHEFTNSIKNLMDNYETFKKYNPHNHVLTHSGSYRDVLYDMYIK